MLKKFLEILFCFQESYRIWVLKDEAPTEAPVYILYTLFWFLLLGLALRFFNVDHMTTMGIIGFMTFMIPLSAFYFAPLWFMLLWIIPAVPCALFGSFLYTINLLVSCFLNRKKKCDFLTQEELLGGYLDFSNIGGGSSGYNKMD